MTQQYSSRKSDHDVPKAVVPTSTYRLQLHPGFPFAAAEAAVPYLSSLGVSHLHLSPVLEAVPGSTHGYDVTDHARVRAELGGEDGLRALAAAARGHGLALVLDIVPNHMAVPTPLRLNRPLWEVLREGPHSPYARWFDIDWEAGGGQLLLPVLGEPARPGDWTVDSEAGVLRHGGPGAAEFPLRADTESLPLPELLAAQWYRPAWWREARTGLNYRRFFTISDLIGVRVEDPAVFAATHAKVLELVRDGVVRGLRIDHVDGLADPAGYLRRLRAEAGDDCWVVVEKILAREERLAPDWPVAGTTGYDALHRIDGLFTDPRGTAELGRAYGRFTGLPDWRETAAAATREVLTVDLAAELAALERLSGPELAEAVRELLIAYPVYRPYPEGPRPSPPTLERAAIRAGTKAVEAVRDLLARNPAFAARFAQTSAALRAKSLEDRAFYRWAPLLSANEVGGEPGAPGVDPEEFHAYCAHLERLWPASGTVLSTHDTKRSADVRARIAVLSEAPETMDADPAHRARGERPATAGADPQLRWVARQSALGLGEAPERAARLAAALLKSAREAGLRTSWTDPDETYEAGVPDLVPKTPAAPAPALERAARANLLGATLLHLAMPGVPEVYQGSEAEYRALVDPDNRRPADFPHEALAALDAGAAPHDTSGEKLALTATLLRLRRDRPALFRGYDPLRAEGPAAHHLVAFTRSPDLLVAVTRLSHRLAGSGGWRGTRLTLPPGDWHPVIPTSAAAPHRGDLPVATLLADGPVGLWIRR
ncbi:malto-oligosyltrehalose synthase [Streptomyces sp. NPDC048606]|uniref:malto-oligosyltrehalose synthase n=1 Tax=Streptomyces sp. NPDC048606 TaxID=3154726 RepID=UPI003426460A